MDGRLARLIGFEARLGFILGAHFEFQNFRFEPRMVTGRQLDREVA